jgi:hypothetical protein
MSQCSACAALEGAPVSTSPHANLLLHTETGINFWETATGRADYYICHECGTEWERDLAPSEPDAVWKHATRPLEGADTVRDIVRQHDQGRP